MHKARIFHWQLFFLAPSTRCPLAPVVANANVRETSTQLGKQIQYVCDDGYKINIDDDYMTCKLTDNYTTVWSGTLPVCAAPLIGSLPSTGKLS